MSKSFRLRKLPKSDGLTGLNGGNRYFSRALPALPYSQVMPMYPNDDRMVWNPQPVEHEITSSPVVTLPDLRIVSSYKERYPDGRGGYFSGGSYYYNPQSTADVITVPENSDAPFGGSFISKPFLRRGGAWGGN